MSNDVWDPAQYERFRKERSQPFYDLLALIRPAASMRIVDLGCGTGALTRHMHEKLGASETLGIDRSGTMLKQAQELSVPGLRFEQRDITQLDDEHRWDLVFSNAALQWLPDHESLLSRLSLVLSPHGQLAVQVPANQDHATHLTAAKVAGEAPFREALDGFVQRYGVLAPEAYAELLYRLGFAEQHVRLSVYAHALPSREHVIEWVKGTHLTGYQQRLDDEMYSAFLARYRDLLLPQLEGTEPHFYPFKRILLWGRK
jgi:trans-aconitate 2-methyltransferase